MYLLKRGLLKPLPEYYANSQKNAILQDKDQPNDLEMAKREEASKIDLAYYNDLDKTNIAKVNMAYSDDFVEIDTDRIVSENDQVDKESTKF